MICPKCKKEYDRLLAISRVDNKTKICDECAGKEALDSVPEKYMTKSQKKHILEYLKEIGINKEEKIDGKKFRRHR